jgi:hypothetical protein
VSLISVQTSDVAASCPYTKTGSFLRRIEEVSRLLVRQFDLVGVLPVALVFFRQDFFEPTCLLFGNPLIHRLPLVSQLVPSGDAWTETVLHDFTADSKQAEDIPGRCTSR